MVLVARGVELYINETKRILSLVNHLQCCMSYGCHLDKGFDNFVTTL